MKKSKVKYITYINIILINYKILKNNFIVLVIIKEYKYFGAIIKV